jgi:hypothetical protein
MRDDAERLRDIRAAIDRILGKTMSGRDAFLIDEMLQYGCCITCRSSVRHADL